MLPASPTKAQRPIVRAGSGTPLSRRDSGGALALAGASGVPRSRVLRLAGIAVFSAALLLLLAGSLRHASTTPVTAARHRRPPPPPPAAAAQCALLEKTELGGAVVRWGASHLKESAADCCAACASEAACTHWVWCGGACAAEKEAHQCWLKSAASPWEDVELLEGRSDRWTSGVRAPRPPPAARPPPSTAPPAFALVFHSEPNAPRVRVRLFAEAAPRAAAFVRHLLRVAPNCTGCRFYRAEPVPPHWGSLEAADSWSGGRWGPPYALMQGSLMPTAADEPAAGLPEKPEADMGAAARPVIRRGVLAWAGGGGGPDPFIALADHPEWGHGHTVWGEVLAEDMAVVDTLMTRPIRVESWGTINASVFVSPLPFSLLSLLPSPPSS